jgi:Epoxide hydrolase N terminus
MSTTVETAIDIRPFHVEIPDEQLADLRRRIAETRWPDKELVDNTSQGRASSDLQALWLRCDVLRQAFGEHLSVGVAPTIRP